MTEFVSSNGRLGEACRVLGGAAEEAYAWFGDHKTLSASQCADLQRQMKQLAREARRLQRAADRPMCAAVFGASQVGKSFLTSSLASSEGQPLTVRLGRRELDFLAEVNPEGRGNEATALVTRFTTRPPDTPSDHPVHVRLLSQADIAKVLMNTYLLDFDIALEKEQEPTPEDVAAVFDGLKNKVRSRPQGDPLSDDDVLDLKEYIDEKFGARPLNVALRNAGYWEDLERFAPNLSGGDLTDVLAFLWGRNEGLSELFTQLQDTLRQVSNAETMCCELDALLPVSESIINVSSLARIGTPSDPKIGVALPGGQRLRVPRATLGALIAEIVMPLSTTPHAYFNHTDLLDFPGYRNRFQIQLRDAQKYLSNRGSHPDLYLRGKVDFLFDAYRREQEITALLLCQAPGNQDAHSIPPLVERWVKDTHGETPEERGQSRTALFVVKTKFDMRFEGATGHDSGERWNKAIQEEHLDFLGRTAKWPVSWAQRVPFRNIFWLRSTEFKNKNVFKYDDKGVEIGFENTSLIEKQKSLYLENPLIQQYVGNAEAAWDAVFAADDCGVKYLTKALDPVCDPMIKTEQVATRLKALARKLLGRLQEYHVDQDGDELTKRREQIKAAFELVLELLQRHLLPAFLETLQLPREELAGTLRRVSFESDQAGRSVAQAGQLGVNIGALREELLGTSRGQTPVAPGGVGGGSRSREAAEVAMSRWRQDLSEVSTRLSGLLGPDSSVDPALAMTISREMREAADRVDLTGRIADRLETFTTGFEKPEDYRDRLALVASNMINDFVCDLGCRHRETPPGFNGSTETIILFPPPEAADLEVDLARGELSHLHDFARSWCFALLLSAEDNVTGGAGPDFDLARNDAIGRIIETAARGSEATA